MTSLSSFKNWRAGPDRKPTRRTIEITRQGTTYTAPLLNLARWMDVEGVYCIKDKPGVFIAYFEDVYDHYNVAALEGFQIVDGKMINVDLFATIDPSGADLYFGAGWRKKSPLTKAKKLFNLYWHTRQP